MNILNKEDCPLVYDDFKTGFSFKEVRQMLRGRNWITRHTVLGKWHEIKLKMYDEYLQYFED